MRKRALMSNLLFRRLLAGCNLRTASKVAAIGWVLFSLCENASAQSWDENTQLQITSWVTSNRENIVDADIVTVPLHAEQAPVDSLIGTGLDGSGYIVAEVLNCTEDSVFVLLKRKINDQGKPQTDFIMADETDCQAGLAQINYDFKVEDLIYDQQFWEYYLVPKAFAIANLAPPVKMLLGKVRPKAAIVPFGHHLFATEKYQADLPSFSVTYTEQDDIFITFDTLFSNVFYGQAGTFEVEIFSGNKRQYFARTFVSEDGQHSFDLSSHEHSLQWDDRIVLTYTFGQLSTQYFLVLKKPVIQSVRFDADAFYYSLRLENNDWYLAREILSIFPEVERQRGGTEVEISHRRSAPLGLGVIGYYEQEMNYDGLNKFILTTIVYQN